MPRWLPSKTAVAHAGCLALPAGVRTLADGVLYDCYREYRAAYSRYAPAVLWVTSGKVAGYTPLRSASPRRRVAP